MRTLYLRNVPDEVGERLERLAARENMSLSAFATRELTQLSKRADNAALLASRPSLDVALDDILDVLDEGRRGT